MEAQPHQSPRSAFILDDNPKVAELVSKFLASIGVVARQFVSPTEFLVELEQSSPDLIVLDLALGESDAVEIIQELDVLQFKGQVLLISGRDETTLAEVERIGRSRGLRMLQPLQKPFRPMDIRNRLDASATPQTLPPDPNVRMSDAKAVEASFGLEEALRKNWLEVWYQPKIDLKSLSVCGAEALVRMRHPERGMINPVSFLPPAGDPLYRPLTHLVMRRTIGDWAYFAGYGFPLRLSINVPASVLKAPRFVEVVRQMISRDSKFPGLTLEITEDEIIRDPAPIYELAVQLRLYNVSLSIDDFGSGYASFSRLKDLPSSELKLDRAFVSNCSSNPLNRGICQTVVDLARRFGVSVCAEGVETADDVRCVTELGFDSAQGFFFARPMPPKEFLEVLLSQSGVSRWRIESAGTGESAATDKVPVCERA